MCIACRVFEESGKTRPIGHRQISISDCNKPFTDQQDAAISCASTCKSWSNAEVCGMDFRAEHADSGTVYQNSIVAASMIVISGTLCLQHEVIEKILELSLSHAAAPAVLFVVRWYRAELVGRNPKCSNVMLMKASTTESPWTQQSAVVTAEKVVKQHCFT